MWCIAVAISSASINPPGVAGQPRPAFRCFLTPAASVQVPLIPMVTLPGTTYSVSFAPRLRRT